MASLSDSLLAFLHPSHEGLAALPVDQHEHLAVSCALACCAIVPEPRPYHHLTHVLACAGLPAPALQPQSSDWRPLAAAAAAAEEAPQHLQPHHPAAAGALQAVPRFRASTTSAFSAPMRSTALPTPRPAAAAAPAVAFPTLQNAPFAVTYAPAGSPYAHAGPPSALVPPLARPIPISMGALGLQHLAATPLPPPQLFNVSSQLIPPGALLAGAWGYGAKLGTTSPVVMAPGLPQIVNMGGLPMFAGSLGHVYETTEAPYA